MNLAVWRYRKILAKYGGPIREIHINNQTTNGSTAMAYLSEDLVPSWQQNQWVIYGRADGTGTATNQLDAINIAISEALERWAFYSTVDSRKYGFDLDASSTGLAAFPGIGSRCSRHIALNEALERWSIIHWWSDKIPLVDDGVATSNPLVHLHFLFTPAKHLAICIAHKKTPFGHVYGYACDIGKARAQRRAMTEMYRNEKCLEHFQLQERNVINPVEKRLLHFSTEEGFSHFQSKLNISRQLTETLPAPKLIVDTEIRGPWTKYARVWRCLFEPHETVGWDDSTKVDTFSF